MPYLALHCGMRVSGVDFSSLGLEKSRRILRATGVQADLIEADILTLDEHRLPPFDALFSLGFLEHFTSPRSVIESCTRLLRAGGLLLSWIPSCECVQFTLNARWNPELRGAHHLTDRQGWVSLHGEAGLDVLEARYVQWLDFSRITFPWLPTAGRRIAYNLLATAGLPVIWLGRLLDIHPQSPRLCLGLVLAARKR
jgi:SAM-dependent methyltransferase